ncbi:hypothetical protein OIU79_003189 [Salix purpurea]|uniref:NB-ARC domain-containing protein n=1 Tax=Salix purpurea TaxID=77065 RepID=A0A9Q0ZEY9_SALPP|nr:hypothetical protein OIU79_003189 [Salix purpurea]
MDLRHDKQGKGSKVVLATGYQIVCNKVETDRSVRLEVLSDEEAWDLFSRKVVDAANSKGISPYATDVVKELATLPSDVGSLKKPEVLPIKDTRISFLPAGICNCLLLPFFKTPIGLISRVSSSENLAIVAPMNNEWWVANRDDAILEEEASLRNFDQHAAQCSKGSNSLTNTSDSNRNSDNWNIELVVLPQPSVQSSAYPVVPESF